MLKVEPVGAAVEWGRVGSRGCYGCMAASLTLSLKLVQALITGGLHPFCPSFLSFLLRLSQNAGSTLLKEQLKAALCFFVKDDPTATQQLTDMINSRCIIMELYKNFV